MKQLAKESPIKQKIFHVALKTARKRNELVEKGMVPGPFLQTKFRFFDKIVFSKLRNRLGGNIRCECSASFSFRFMLCC
jgi:long-chain acyl-CoA synthetase